MNTSTKNFSRPVRLIVSDVDGTLVTENKTITPSTIDSILKAQAKGCEVAIASGRSWNEMMDVRSQLPSIRYYICSNGARIIDAKENKTLFHDAYTPSTGVKILRSLAPYDVLIEAYVGDYIYADASYLPRIDEFTTAHIQPLVLESRTFIDNMIDFVEKNGVPIDKIQFFYGTNAKRDLISKNMQGSTDFHMIFSSERNMEFTKPGLNKGNALKQLAERLTITPEEIMAIGDSNNDIPMLTYAGYSYAMANGTDTAKKAARFQAPSNENDGVAFAIDAVLNK